MCRRCEDVLLSCLVKKVLTTQGLMAGSVLQVNIPERDLILSEQATMVEALAGSLTNGDVVEGVVTRLMDYGAFVSLRSPDGGMHGAVVSHLTT